ncbi:hypothetical protein Tco_0854019 [Tanacetum coccineum]
MGPLLKVSDEDKKRGILKHEKKIKAFYRGCLSLVNEYKFDQDVVDWIQGCIDDGMTYNGHESNLKTQSRSWEAVIETGSTHNHMGIKSLRDGGDNLKDFRQISNLEAMLREFLFNSTLSFFFHSLMYNRHCTLIKWGME